jgi:hypothetical protein
MEILVNTNSILDSELKNKCTLSATGQSELSYQDFDICDLLEQRKVNGIGLWYLYLPTLSHLLLADKKVPVNGVQQLADTIVRWREDEIHYVRDITDAIREHYKNGCRIIVFYRLDDMRRALERGDVGIIFGGSSAILAAENRKDGPIQALIPREGLLIWVNCGALIETKQTNPHGESLIGWWMEKDVQNRLCGYSEYRGCPVEKIALFETRNSTSHPAAPTLRKVITENNTLNEQYLIAIRGFPEHIWRAWAHCWEGMMREITPVR